MQDPSTLNATAAGNTDPLSASSALIDHIHSSNEHQKALLARELHDELGGLLVGAVMDVAWAEQHIATPGADLKQKLTRARQTLAAAIDLKRKLIEELRPTLLDNVGLFAALRWHVEAICKRANVACTVHLPEEERRFLTNIPIALFRIVQETFAVIVVATPATAADFAVKISRQTLNLSIVTQATGAEVSPQDAELAAHSLAAVGYRIEALGGSFDHAVVPAGGDRLQAAFPLTRILSPASAA